MNRIETAFFELIRVAVGSQLCLSLNPTDVEWREIYDLAKKQSVLGICFAGVQRLKERKQIPPELLYLKWMGIAAKIQHRNEIVTIQCSILQTRFTDAGFSSCILKGQGVAMLYGEHLQFLRQSGDIDIWVKEDMDRVIAWLNKEKIALGDVDSVHVPASFFKDTEVEVHFRPSYMYAPNAEQLLMRFFKEEGNKQFANWNEKLKISYPTVAFNLVFSMVHINRHIYSEGIGLRQLLDYNMILKASTPEERSRAYDLLVKMKISKFVAGIVHILNVYFGLDSNLSLCDANPAEGEFLLQEIMRGGNFGHYDDRNSNLPKGMRWHRGWWSMKRMVRYSMHYPSESLSMPVWKLKHYIWRKQKGFI